MFLKSITCSKSPWTSLSSYKIRFQFIPIRYKRKIEHNEDTLISTDMTFFHCDQNSFLKIFITIELLFFLKKQLYILIELEILYHSVFIYI